MSELKEWTNFLSAENVGHDLVKKENARKVCRSVAPDPKKKLGDIGSFPGKGNFFDVKKMTDYFYDDEFNGYSPATYASYTSTSGSCIEKLTKNISSSVSVSGSHGFECGAAVSASVGVEMSGTNTFSSETNFAQTHIVLKFGSVNLPRDPDGLRKLANQEVLDKIDTITTFNEAQDVVDMYGPCYFAEASFGAKLVMTSSTKKSEVTTDTELATQMEAEVSNLTSSVGGSAKIKLGTKKFKGTTSASYSVYTYGGDSCSIAKPFAVWAKSAAKDHVISEFKLGPISNLARKGTKTEKWLLEACKSVSMAQLDSLITNRTFKSRYLPGCNEWITSSNTIPKWENFTYIKVFWNKYSKFVAGFEFGKPQTIYCSDAKLQPGGTDAILHPESKIIYTENGDYITEIGVRFDANPNYSGHKMIIGFYVKKNTGQEFKWGPQDGLERVQGRIRSISAGYGSWLDYIKVDYEEEDLSGIYKITSTVRGPMPNPIDDGLVVDDGYGIHVQENNLLSVTSLPVNHTKFQLKRVSEGLYKIYTTEQKMKKNFGAKDENEYSIKKGMGLDCTLTQPPKLEVKEDQVATMWRIITVSRDTKTRIVKIVKYGSENLYLTATTKPHEKIDKNSYSLYFIEGDYFAVNWSLERA